MRPLPLLLVAVAVVGASAACGGASGRTVTINGMNMRPTLVEGDRVHFDTHAHVMRGSIILFRGAAGWVDPQLGPKNAEFVDRVVALGGDHISCCDSQDRIDLNGAPLDESHFAPGSRPATIPFDAHVPADCVWLLGDNVNDSADSRAHLANGYGGALPTVYIIGVATKIVAPARRAHRL